jgi:L,D-transpeptidase catalytic domain/Putative peptidoglycan binding domain
MTHKTGIYVLSVTLLTLLVPVNAHSLAGGENPQKKPQSSSFTLRIDLNQPLLSVYRNGSLYGRYKVALGKPETPTPVGAWCVVDKQQNWGGGFGTRWLGLDVPWGTYGIHGTNRPESIGHYASNGCIRMNNADVESLYNLIPLGTEIIISGNPMANRRTLVIGHIGADVHLVQQRLRQAGYFRGPLNGRFDANLEFCLGLYELAQGLPMDGVVGGDDYAALGLL